MAFTTTASGLQYEDSVVGTGAQATRGQSVRVHYTGWLYENCTRASASLPDVRVT